MRLKEFSGKNLKHYLTILLSVIAMPLFAQEDTGEAPPVAEEPVMITSEIDVLLSQHWAMPTLLNPGATGDIDYIRVRGGARLDYLGSRQSPKSFLAAADSPFKLLGKRIGAGLIVNSYNYWLFRNLLVDAQGSYKMKIKNSTLSIGVQIGYYHTKFKGSELRMSDFQDPDNGTPGEEGEGDEESGEGSQGVSGSGTYNGLTIDDLPTHDVGGGALDFGVGIRFEHPKFYVGISGMHLTNSIIRLATEGESASDARYIRSKLPATLYFDTGGNIPIHNSLISLQPSLIAATDFSNFSGVVVMRATYNNLVSFGADYRYNRAAGLMASLNLKNFFIGYSWEYDYKSHPRGSTGNHEIVLGYQFKLDMGGKNLFSHRSIRIM